MFGLSLTSIKLIGLFAGAAVIAILTAMVTHKVDQAQYVQLQLNYSQAQVKVVQQAQRQQMVQDQIATNAAVADAANQTKIVTQIQTVKQEVIRYVPDTTHCITYGVLRVLDASALGLDPATLILPTGKSDAACADIKPSDLVGIIAGNYGAARANAQQLADLQAYIAAAVKASQP